MRRRADGAGCVVLALLAGCVELPRAPSSAEGAAPDASLLVQDAGSRRPPTADGPPAPGCVVAPGGGSGGQGAGSPTGNDGGGLGTGGAPSVGGDGTAPRLPGAASEIVITELMSDPALVADGDGEWIELHNPGASALDLAGCALDDGGAAKPIAEALLVPAGGLVTIARSTTAGFTPDRTLPIALSNEADAIALECQGVVIDRVAYGAGHPLAPGVSLSLDPGAFDAAANDDPAAWCPSPSASYAERGTPGEINEPCHADADAGR